MSVHPSPEKLALYMGKDLDFWNRIRIAVHLQGCRNCSAEAASLRTAREKLRNEAFDLPPDLNWDRLAGEMRANIRLGLAAGALVETGREETISHDPAGWRLAVVLGSVAFVALAGWLLQTPRPVVPAVLQPASRVVLDARPDGLALEQQGATLTLLSPAKQAVTTTVGWDGSARNVGLLSGGWLFAPARQQRHLTRRHRILRLRLIRLRLVGVVLLH